MRRPIAILVAAVFSAVAFSAYAADTATPTTPPAKHAKKKKHKSTGVSQSANPVDKSGQGAAQSSGTGGVQAGVTSPTPKGAGRADNQ